MNQLGHVSKLLLVKKLLVMLQVLFSLNNFLKYSNLNGVYRHFLFSSIYFIGHVT